MDEQPPVPVPQKPFPLLPVILSVLVLLSLSSTAYLAYQNMQLTNQLTQLTKAMAYPSPSPIPTRVPTQSSSPAIPPNWKTYTNTTMGFTLKYPNDYIVLTEKPVVSFGFGVGSVSPSPYLNIANVNTVSLSQLQHCEATSPGPFCLADGKGNGQVSDIVDTSLDGQPAKSFYMSSGVDSLYHIIQTTNRQFELKMYVAGGGLDKSFSQILSTFTFMEASTATKCASDKDCSNNSFCDISTPQGLATTGSVYPSPSVSGSRTCITRCQSGSQCPSGKCVTYDIIVADVVTGTMGCKP